jgi:hypothetical protein
LASYIFFSDKKKEEEADSTFVLSAIRIHCWFNIHPTQLLVVTHMLMFSWQTSPQWPIDFSLSVA